MSNKLINAGNLNQALTAFYTKSTALFATKAELDSGLAGKANSSHGTHVTYATSAPKANGTAAIGTANRVAREDHVHPLQTTVSGNAGSANKVNNNLAIKLNGGTTEGTNLFTFNGSAAKTIDITPSSIGAAASSHGTHLTIGTGASNAAAGNHTHSYLPLSGGTITGDLTLHTSTSGASPSLIFQRSTTTGNDSYTDWKIQDVGGNLIFSKRMNSTDFTDVYNLGEDGVLAANSFTEGGTALSSKYAAASHGTHLTLGTGSGNAYRGDYGNTAYNHSQAAHAPSNAQKNSDITKAEIEAKLTGAITSHTHAAVNGYTIWTGTKSQYDAITSKSSSTLYFIKE